MDDIQTDYSEELTRLGMNIDRLIKECGYSSAYQFWIHEVGDQISRKCLSNVISGKTDPRFTTLLKIARALSLSVSDLVDTNENFQYEGENK